jgi:hypothetical protein
VRPAQRRQFGRRQHADAEQGDWGKMAPTGGPHLLVTACGNGRQAGSHAEMSRGRRRAGPAVEKMAHDDIFLF